MPARIQVLISGEVQGVFFRSFLEKKAKLLKLTGWVRNNPDGTVEVVAEGDKPDLESLIKECWKGTSGAVVKDVKSLWSKATGEFDSFKIRY